MAVRDDALDVPHKMNEIIKSVTSALKESRFYTVYKDIEARFDRALFFKFLLTFLYECDILNLPHN